MIKYVCDLTELEAEATQDDEFDLPVGWLEVRVRRKIPNPAYAPAWAEYEAQRASAREQVIANAEAQGVTPTEEQIDQAIAIILSEPDEDELIIDEYVRHVSAEGAGVVFGALDIETDDAAGSE